MIKPLKHLGQNFLKSRKFIDKIIEAAEIKSQDIVLEIGPGTGALTKKLCQKAKKVIAVEKDPRMVEFLKENLKEFKNLEIIQGDVLKFSIRRLVDQGKNYKAIGNLPFYIAAPIIRKFLGAENPPATMIFTVQKEVGQRICPCPPKLEERRRGATPKMSLLAVSIQFFARAKLLFYIPKRYFSPRPKVDSAVIKITPFQNKKTTKDFEERFFKIVKAGFSHPRKQLINNLSAGFKLPKENIINILYENNINPKSRAENLTVQNWIDLAEVL